MSRPVERVLSAVNSMMTSLDIPSNCPHCGKSLKIDWHKDRVFPSGTYKGVIGTTVGPMWLYCPNVLCPLLQCFSIHR